MRPEGAVPTLVRYGVLSLCALAVGLCVFVMLSLVASLVLWVVHLFS